MPTSSRRDWCPWIHVQLLLLLLLLNCLFNVTINDISVIYVTAHRCAGGLKKKYDLRSGSQRHRHFVGFFNVPVLAPTRDEPFYTVIPTHRPIQSPFTITLGICSEDMYVIISIGKCIFQSVWFWDTNEANMLSIVWFARSTIPSD